MKKRVLLIVLMTLFTTACGLTEKSVVPDDVASDDLTVTTPQTSAENSQSESVYILEHSDREKLKLLDVSNLNDRQLLIAYYEIYARHGKVFEDEKINEYFESMAWYKIDEEYTDDLLNGIELKNIDFIGELLEIDTYDSEPVEVTQLAEIAAQIPVVASITADTEMIEKDKKGNTYYHTADKMIDGTLNNVWTDNVGGYQVGQQIIVNFNDTYNINYLGMYNGHQKSSELFYKNDRIKQITVTFDDDLTEIVHVPDQMGLSQLYFEQIHPTQKMVITVDDLYGGSLWHDVCIAELTFDPSITYTAQAVERVSTNSGYYIFPSSNTRYISESELYGHSTWELYLIRNEIYARHGYPFQHQDLKDYFAGQTWYTKNYAFNDSFLSDIERENIQTILDYERSIGSSYLK